jgi:5-methylcytosine-specific restriction enzyme A
MPTIPKATKFSWTKANKGAIVDSSRIVYRTNRWTKISKINLKANPLCATCLQQGISKPAQATDHIVPIRDGGDPFDTSNLQSLCTYHNALKAKDDTKIRENGKGRGL